MNAKEIENLGFKALRRYLGKRYGPDQIDVKDIRNDTNLGCDAILTLNGIEYYIELKASTRATLPTNIRFAHQTIATMHNAGILQQMIVTFVYNLDADVEDEKFIFFRFGDFTADQIAVEPHFIIQPKRLKLEHKNLFRDSLDEVLESNVGSHEIGDLFKTRVDEHMNFNSNKYLKLYDLERYLFDDVSTTFRKNQKLSAFDFFCIIIWKANRSKSMIARKLVAHDGVAGNDLDAIVAHLTSAIFNALDDKSRMKILIEDWAFRLPMASAILTVLYPTSFTVYDVRVCDELQNHHKVQNKTRFEDLWDGYQAFVEVVKRREPEVSALRDKDRTLWAKSFEQQLNDDISTLFKKGDE